MKLRKAIINSISFIVMLSMLASFTSVYYAEEETYGDVNNDLIDESEEENYGVEEDPFDRLTVDETSEMLANIIPEAEEKYDPRNKYFITTTKDQNPLKLCWSCATASLAEQFVAKKFGTKFDVSELHAAVALSDSINTNGMATGYYRNNYNNGAFFSKSAQYYTNWNSPLFNYSNCTWNAIVSDEKYAKQTALNGKEVRETINVDSRFTDLDSLFNITDIKYISNDENTIKYFIKNCGGVYTNFHYEKSYEKAIKVNYEYAYNNDKIGNNHAVNIIGWDDNFSKNNFNSKCRPENDGAWLIKNSWNRVKYFWISYEDVSLINQSYMCVILGAQKASDNEYMLSNDFYPISSGKDKIVKNKVYFANIYDISNFTDEYNKINKVMFYYKGTDCTYNIKISQLENNQLPTTIDDVPVFASGEFNGEGYITASLDYEYYFTSNKNCAIILEVIPNNPSSEIYLPRESKYFNQTPEINSFESMYYVDNMSGEIIKWIDCANDSTVYGNFCIRPIIKKRTSSVHNIILDNTVVTDTSKDFQINIISDSSLFCVRSNNEILRQDIDYTYNDDTLVLKKEYLQKLGNNSADIIFEFNNDVTKRVTVNPKSEISNIEIQGLPIIGETLSAGIVAVPEKDEYDVSYQWECSKNGENWEAISGATEKEFTISNLLNNQYIRLTVFSKNFGNIVFPFSKSSSPTKCKVVLIGDANQDGTLNIVDATTVQRCVAELIQFNDEQKLAADVNRDGDINIVDATAIQKIIAGIN